MDLAAEDEADASSSSVSAATRASPAVRALKGAAKPNRRKQVEESDAAAIDEGGADGGEGASGEGEAAEAAQEKVVREIVRVVDVD